MTSEGDQAQPARTRIRVATYNILAGGGQRWAQIGALVEAMDPDVIAMQELEDPAPMFRLAERLGYAATFGPAPRFRHQGVLSRLPVISWRNHQDPRAYPRNSLELRLRTPDGFGLRIHTVHLTAAFQRRGRAEPDRVRELSAVREQAAAGGADAHLILGDFNALAPGERIRAAAFLALLAEWRRAGVLDPAGGRGGDSAWSGARRGEFAPALELSPVARDGMPRLPWVFKPLLDFLPHGEGTDVLAGAMMPRDAVAGMARAGYVDCLRRLHPRGDQFTCPTYEPAVRIDYIFASAALAVALRTCQVVGRTGALAGLARRASDHFPVMAEFEVVAA